MDSLNGERKAATAAPSGVTDSPELRRLTEARVALDHARQNAQWKRQCKTLQSAAHEVQEAALAALNTGFGWTQIGDVLGIERAMKPSAAAIELPLPTPLPSASPEPAPSKNRTHDTVTVKRHLSPAPRWGLGRAVDAESA